MTLPLELQSQFLYLWRLEVSRHQPTDLYEVVSYTCYDRPVERQKAMSTCEALEGIDGIHGKTHFEALPVGECPGCHYPQHYLHIKECKVNQEAD